MNKIPPILHPERDMLYQPKGMNIVSAQGIELHDVSGKIYLDAISGLWNVSFGYSNPYIIDKIKKQLYKIQYNNLYYYATDNVEIYAKRLLNLLGVNFVKLVYTCSGSESLEVALKICRKYQKLKGNERSVIGVLDISYHGTTYGAMSLSGMESELIKSFSPKVEGIELINTLNFNKLDGTNCKYMDELNLFLDKWGNQLAGIIIEPILGSAGVIQVPNEYVHYLKNYCEENDILLVFDEVATGFGRTGDFFCMHSMDIHPDIVCVSKGINSGYLPMGAVALSKKIYDVFLFNNARFEHLSTQNGNPLSCAAAEATLDLLLKEGVMEEIQYKGEYFRNRLREELAPYISEFIVRGKGLMIAIEIKLLHGNIPNPNQIFDIVDKIRDKGVIVYMFTECNIGTGISLFPAFTVTKDEITRIINVISKVFSRLK